MSDGYFEGRSIIITGGAGAIGMATARMLLSAGANVVLIDIDERKLTAAKQTLGKLGNLRTIASRIGTPDDCARAVNEGGNNLHALVHMAGIYVPDMDMPPEDSRRIFDDVITANLTNAYDMANAFADRVKDADPLDPPRMVFASSIAFRRGSFDHAAYSAAKGGIAGLVRAMARRHAPGILINGLAPGVIDTPMPRHILDVRRDQILSDIPLGRLGQAEEVAGVVKFLCGPDATYITAQIINVDGGMIPS